MKWCFIAFLLFLGSLFFREQRLPDCVLHALCERCSVGGMVVVCDNAYFSFRRGLRLAKLKVYDSRRQQALEPLAAVRWLAVDVFFSKVTVCELRFPRLGDSYYAPGNASKDESLDLVFPAELGDFTLELIRPKILGLEPQRAEVEVSVEERRVTLRDIFIEWQDAANRFRLNGSMCVDLDRQLLHGEVSGYSMCELIRPLLVSLDVKVAVEYMDAFTEVPPPVPASCEWTVNLRNNDLDLVLDLHPQLGRYRGVPMSRADGKVRVRGWCRDNNFNYRTEVGPIDALDKSGRSLRGTVVAFGSHRADEPARLEIDAESELELKDILAFTEVLDGDTLSCLECEDAPTVGFRGVLATCVADQRSNRLFGHGRFGRSKLMGIPFADARFDFAYVGSDMVFSNLVATGAKGGKVTGTAGLSVPGLSYSNSTYRLDLEYRDGSVEELFAVVGIEPGGRRGRADAKISLAAPLNERCVSGMNGRGHLEVKDGHLNQMRLFAGMTAVLAEKVPGIDKIVNQSSGSCDFTISNGVMRIENAVIEGSLFSIHAGGTIDLTAGGMDMLVRVQLFRNNSVADYVAWPVTWTFSKLLTELRLTGTFAEPKWDYISVVDRIWR